MEDKIAKADSIIQHLTHKLEGYRGFVIGEPNPFSPGSARAKSWDEGWFDAKQDFDTWHPDWEI